MKIITNNQNIKLINLNNGDIFRYMSSYYIVTDIYEPSRTEILCVSLESGNCHYFESDTLVEYCEAEVTLK